MLYQRSGQNGYYGRDYITETPLVWYQQGVYHDKDMPLSLGRGAQNGSNTL